MPATAVLQTDSLTKSYGPVKALVDLSLEVHAGEIFGFLGPNGAGKTTTIRLLLGLLRPSRGGARILGWDTWRRAVKVRESVGYLPGDVRLYEALTGRALLELFMRLRGRRVPVDDLADRLRLDLSKRIKTYSKGMRQKLGLIQALMHHPPLLILDEPTASLDPLMQEELYALLRERREEGATIFFSSHILSEVEKICDRVGIVRAGRLLTVEGVEDIQRFRLRQCRIDFREPEAAVAELRRQGIDVTVLDGQSCEFTVRGDIDPVVKLLAQFHIDSLSIEPMSLEDVFFQLYRGESPEGGT